jgi:hypothetical protein
MGPAADSPAEDRQDAALPPVTPAQDTVARGNGVALEISADATIPSMSSLTSMSSQTRSESRHHKPKQLLSVAPKIGLPMLKLHKIRRKEHCDDIYASSERKTIWEDSIRRLHLLQMEERHSVNRLAVTTLRDKRAEWVGAPVNEEGSLDSLLEGGPGDAGAAAVQKKRANKRAMDALITPRGASMLRLSQAGLPPPLDDPRRWISKIQVS